MKSTLLVHGLRNESVSHIDDEDSLWHRLANVLLSHWPEPEPLHTTVKAEEGLGIPGSPYYFYVMRSHKAFGYIVFLFEEAQSSASMSADTKGATPFDTGGLWLGEIHPVDDKDKSRSIFTREEVPLKSWRKEFLSYMDRNYTNARDYITGRPPAHGIDGIANNAQENETRAWTWEVRYPFRLASSWLRLEHAYMHSDDYANFWDWLPRSDYEDDEVQIIASEMRTKIKVHHGETTMAFSETEAALLALI